MNYKIVIDPGHGGDDPGASGNDIVEKDLTLKISNYMKNRFDELGINSAINRTTDITLNPDNRVDKTLSHYGNGENVIVLSNHINAGGGEGAEIIYALRDNDTLPRLIGSELEKEGQIIRKYYQRRLPSNPSKDYYYMIRKTPDTQAMLIEYGFLDNTADAQKLKNNWEEYAEAVVRAIASYIGVPYISNSGNYYTVQKGDTLFMGNNEY